MQLTAQSIKLNDIDLVNFNKCLKYAIPIQQCSVNAAIDDNGLPFMLLRVKTSLGEDVPLKLDLPGLVNLEQMIKEFKAIIINNAN